MTEMVDQMQVAELADDRMADPQTIPHSTRRGRDSLTEGEHPAWHSVDQGDVAFSFVFPFVYPFDF